MTEQLSRPPRPAALWPYFLFIAAVLAVSGCAHMEQTAKSTNLCTEYAKLVQVANQFTAQDLTGATAEDLQFRDNGLQTQLDAVAAVSDGRLDSEIATLQASLDDYAATVEASANAPTAAEPLIKKSLKGVKDSWAMLQDAAATECGPTPQT
jgi:hypothetical protein